MSEPSSRQFRKKIVWISGLADSTRGLGEDQLIGRLTAPFIPRKSIRVDPGYVLLVGYESCVHCARMAAGLSLVHLSGGWLCSNSSGSSRISSRHEDDYYSR